MQNNSLGFNKQAINLEEISLQEEKLAKILNSLRFNSNILNSCEDYFEFINMLSNQNLDGYWENPNEIKRSSTLEILAVGCVILVIQNQKLDESTTQHFKNILYNVHQNFLTVLELLLCRLAKYVGDSNTWVAKLKSEVIIKRAKFESNDETSLKENNKIITNQIRKLITSKFKANDNDGQIYSVLNGIIKNIDIYPVSTVKNILTNLKSSLQHYFMSNRSNVSLQPIQAPYLPPIENKTYTLVLDLDETLVHYVNQPEEGKPIIRPGAQEFLEEMSKYYELVVFTAALQDYADWILDLMDKDRKLIKHRLYRFHASINKTTYVKDISKLGRDLSKTIIIDNVYENFQLQPENGIFIKTWLDDPNDTCLSDLMPLLREIVIKGIPDVRKVLRKVRDSLIRLYIKGDQNPYETLKKNLLN